MSGSLNNSRLFVPLTKEAYNWFYKGKVWEVRKLNVGQYNLKNVVIGRSVELRLGYNIGNSIWSKILEVKVFDNINDLLKVIPYNLIIPEAKNHIIAKSFIEKYIGSEHKVLAFKINIVNNNII